MEKKKEKTGPLSIRSDGGGGRWVREDLGASEAGRDEKVEGERE